MSSSFTDLLRSLNCFRRRQTVIDGTASPSQDSIAKTPRISVNSIDLTPPTEKKDELFPPDDLVHHQLSAHGPQSQISRVNPALVVALKGCYEIRDSYAFPALNHDREVIIRSHAVGLNPIDWKSVDYGFCLPEFPWITGREMAGVIEQVGSGVTDLYVGQRVWTSMAPRSFLAQH